MNSLELARRHEGHEHSNVHQITAYKFWGLCFGIMIIYSLVLFIRGKIQPAKRFRYSVPWWLQTIVWAAVLVYGLQSHARWYELKWTARRFGRLAFAIAIFSQYLAMKPALLPRTYVLPLTFIHKWVGRTAVLFGVIHGSLYFYSYYDMGLVSLLFTWDNLCGFAAVGAYIVMFLTSLLPIRRRWYFIFYVVHSPLAFISTIALIWHARPSASLMVEVSLFFFALQIGWRVVFSKTVPVTTEHVTPTLDLITIDRSALPQNFEIGSYLRLGPRLWNPKAWLFASHPYTVSSLDSDSDIKLIVRKTRFQIQTQLYSVWGPFHAPFDMTNYQKVVVIAGGSGLAIIPPMVRASNGTETKVKSIWITRSNDEIAILERVHIDVCDVYVTGGQTQEGYDDTVPDRKDEEAIGTDTFELETLHAEDEFVVDDDDHETTETGGSGEDHRLLSSSASSPGVEKGIRTFRGRPSFDTALSSFISAMDTKEDTCVVACGPSALVHDAQKWAQSRKLAFFAEEFSI